MRKYTCNGVTWEMLHNRFTPEMLGWIPGWLNINDPDPIWKQIDKRYKHGGGWHTSGSKEQTTLRERDNALLHPEDPPQLPLARAALRDEEILFYPYAFVVIKQKGGEWDLCRVD